MPAYCVRCKTQREMSNPEAVFTSRGVPATSGICPECGTKLFRMGRTPDHEHLTPPTPAERPAAKKNGNGAKSNRRGKLVIVESPAKAKTISRYLGKGYTVRACYGHVRDLLRSQLSVDVENDFEPKYRVPNDKRAVVKEIKQEADKAAEIYLATDLDREGEAIAWHLLEAAEMEPDRTRRVVFSEITKPAIIEAFEHTRNINMDLVDAQRARRILDRLVGYSLSPLLWNKVRGRLSAGRVQSVAVRLIVDREREIDNFEAEEYWSIHALLSPAGDTAAGSQFEARLIKIGAQEVGLNKDIPLGKHDDVLPILAELERAEWVVTKVKEGERRRRPAAPFTTSTLQQDASRRLNFTAKRTMSVAQQLYEGVDLGDGPVGLITYMRTDSTNVSKLAQDEARTFITDTYGADYLPATAPQYTTRAKGAQEAHEAIRPTSVLRTPKEVKPFLKPEQLKLYTLIWQRFVASQMNPAVYATITVDIDARRPQQTYAFRASGSQLRFRGFLVVYEEAQDEDIADDDASDRNNAMPALKDDQALDLHQLLPEQHFTQPPPRYTEASLVKTLEEFGIGRPSTYAPIISTVQERGYVVREDKRLFPTEIGILVNDLLVEHFANIVDLNFTANMEDELDRVADGEMSWIPVIDQFWQPFAQQVSHAEAVMPRVEAAPEQVGRDCPECSSPLIIRQGRYGKFIGCSNFPTCRHVEPLLTHIHVACPKDGGELVERRTRKGRIFYGCANYPECDFTSWLRPLPQPCPKCGGLLMQANKKTARCSNCQHEVSMDELVPVAEAEDFSVERSV